MNGGTEMDVREKLIELIAKAKYICANDYSDHTEDEYIADTLLDNGVTVQEWVSVKERLPQEKVNCIVHYKHAYCDNDDYWAIGMCFYDGEKFRVDPAYKVTHWMPLPQPPKGE